MDYLKQLLGDKFKEGMTLDAVSEELENLELSTPEEVDKIKTSLSKANSENADWKKKYRALERDKGSVETETNKKLDKLQEAYNGLARDKSIAEQKAQFLALGYEAELASSTAEAMVDGDTATVFANQKKHQVNLQKQLEAKLLQDTPTPPAGEGTNKEEFKNMTVTEKMKLKNEDPELFKQLMEVDK